MSTKQRRPVPRLPAGFGDAFAGVARARRKMINTISEVYERFGFEPLETPVLEFADSLGKFLPEADEPTGGVFAFRDSDALEQWLILRYDLTAPLARAYAQNVKHEIFAKPYRRFQIGPVWRDEEPGPGRFRQFYQCDFDTIGTRSIAADAEVCAVLAAAFDALGFTRTEYVIKVNNRKILDGVLDNAGVSDTRARTVSLRALDKLDRLGEGGVRALLGEGRKDPSGHFTAGAGLTVEQQTALMAFVSVKGDTRAAVCDALRVMVGESKIGQAGVDELVQIDQLVTAMGLGEGVVKFDPSIVRGLGYYTGAVFEAELTFEIIDAKGIKRSFGSVAGGGRYDDLVKRFTGQPVPAVGASIGISRLMAALEITGRIKLDQDPGPIVVSIMDRKRLVDYQAMVTELRNAGIAAELYLGNPKKFGKQMEYADKRRSPAVVIAGGDEFDAGQVSIKDLKLGTEMAAKLKEMDDPDAYQDQMRDAVQRTVQRTDLVAEVRRILQR